MANEDYNSGCFGCFVIIIPYVIIGILMLIYYAIRNHVI